MDLAGKNLDRLAALLRGLQGGTGQAMAAALNEGVKTARTRFPEEILDVYAVKNPLEGSTAQTQRADSRDLAGYLQYAGVKIPLYRFSMVKGRAKKRRVPVLIDGGWRLMSPGPSVRANVRRENAPRLMNGAFVAEMSSGHLGIFERTGPDRAIQERMGLSTAQMAGQDGPRGLVEADAAQAVEAFLHSEVDRMLGRLGVGL